LQRRPGRKAAKATEVKMPVSVIRKGRCERRAIYFCKISIRRRIDFSIHENAVTLGGKWETSAVGSDGGVECRNHALHQFEELGNHR
jgi:hypothetical protein